jgi:hypothetical protein
VERIQTGFFNCACTNALSKSIEHVTQPKSMAKVSTIRTVGQWTMGAYVFSSSSIKSPRQQKRALYFLISPSGVRLRRKTQVPGMILDWALDLVTSIQVLFASRTAISAQAAATHWS